MVKKIEDMNIKELKAEAKEQGFKSIGKLKKDALLEALRYAAKPSTIPPPPPPEAPPEVPPPPEVKPTRTRTRRAPIKETVGEIENGVPIPAAKEKGKYPLEALKPGGSFLVMCPPKDAKKIRLNIMNAARRVTKKTGATFLVQVRPEEKGVRCWRTDKVEVKAKVAPKRAAKKAPEISTLGATGSEIGSEEPIELTDEVSTPSLVIADDPGAPGPPPITAPTPFKLFG